MQAFLEFLANLREGQLIDEAHRALTELEEAVNDTGKKGTLTITIDLERVNGAAFMVGVIDKLVVKAPVRDREKTLLFRAENGRFTRRDPRQPDLPGMRAIAGGRADVNEEGEIVNG